MLKKRIGIAAAALVMATAGGLALASQGEDETDGGAGAGLANPASVFCEEQGGTVEIVTEAEGSYGVCHLPDGSEVEEWEYWRRFH